MSRPRQCVPESKERFARLKEAIDLIQTLWRDGRISYHGTRYRTDRVTNMTGRACRCRLSGRVRSGHGPARRSSRRRLHRHLGQTGGPCTKTPCYRRARGAEKAGRPYADIDLQIKVKFSLDPDRARAVSDTRYWATLSLTPEEKFGIDDPLIMPEHPARLPMDRVVFRWIVSSDPEEHVERISSYLDMGFRHLVFHAPGPDQSRFLALYGRHILPALRTRFTELSEKRVA